MLRKQSVYLYLMKRMHDKIMLLLLLIIVDLWRDFGIRETGTGQQVAQLHEIYIVIIIIIIIYCNWAFAWWQ